MSAQGEPVRNRQKMPFKTRRASTRCTPRGLFSAFSEACHPPQKSQNDCKLDHGSKNRGSSQMLSRI